MKTKLLLLISLLLIAFLVYLVEKTPWRGRKDELLFPGVVESVPSKIEIKNKGKLTILERKGGKWVVATSGGYQASEAEVEEILENVKEFRRGRVVSRNPKKRSIFQVDEKDGIEVKILDSDETSLAHFYIGKSGPDYMSTYIRVKGSDEVLLVDGYLRADFGKESGRWRDRTIFDFDYTQVERITLKREGDEIVVSRDEEGNWLIEAPVEAKADKEKVERLLEDFSSLKCSDFAEGMTLKECGLEEGGGEKIVAYLKDGESRGLLFGGETEQGERYVKREDKETIFLLSKYRVKNLLKDVEELREEE